VLPGRGLCVWPIPCPEQPHRVCVTEYDQVQQQPFTLRATRQNGSD